ncbi:MAG: DUF4330 domain-containing protein [Syntrophomonadaceae bacterium]
MLDEKGRLFGLINIVDLAVVLLILVLAGGYFWSKRAPADTAVNTATIKVICPYLRPEVARQIHEGDQLLARGQIQPVFIKEIRVEPANDTASDAKGQIILQKHPFRQDVYLTIEGPIANTGGELYLAGQQIRAGLDKYIVKTQFFEAQGEILEVVVK